LSDGEALWNDAVQAAPSTFSPGVTRAVDPAFIHYTDLGMSGSVISHLAALPLYHTARRVVEMQPGESIVSVAMPGDHLFLTYGLLAPLLAGSTIVAMEEPGRFTRWAEVAAEVQPSAWFSSYKAMEVMLRVDANLGTVLRGCRNIACAWPYDPGFVSMTTLSYGSPIHAMWTEREFGAIQCAEVRGGEVRSGSVGRAVPGADVRVVDYAGVPIPLGAPGKLAVKVGIAAPFVEYWGDESLTASQMRDGWFITPYAARMDAEGYVWLV
jgi:acetyl-CoA synthetase